LLKLQRGGGVLGSEDEIQQLGQLLAFDFLFLIGEFVLQKVDLLLWSERRVLESLQKLTRGGIVTNQLLCFGSGDPRNHLQHVDPSLGQLQHLVRRGGEGRVTSCSTF
jgi:hypothetical protein